MPRRYLAAFKEAVPEYTSGEEGKTQTGFLQSKMPGQTAGAAAVAQESKMAGADGEEDEEDFLS